MEAFSISLKWAVDSLEGGQANETLLRVTQGAQRFSENGRRQTSRPARPMRMGFQNSRGPWGPCDQALAAARGPKSLAPGPSLAARCECLLSPNPRELGLGND